MLILEVSQMLQMYMPMMRQESVFSEVNFYIWKRTTTQQKKNSLMFIKQLPRTWRGKKLLSEH